MALQEHQPIDECVFCSKAVTEKSFYSEAKFSALYNLAPVLPGHSLVIPNNHYESVEELSDRDLGEMIVFARKVTQVLKTVFECDGFDWTIQDGISAGQTVPHLHLHIIPRKADDLPKGVEWYSKIQENEIQMLDSQQRERLNGKEYFSITARLAESCRKIML